MKMRILPKYKEILLLFFFIPFAFGSYAQKSRVKTLDSVDSVNQVAGKFMVVPLAMIGYGFAQYTLDPVLDLNLKVRGEITSRITSQWHIDNYTQYAPAAAVYGLNLFGVKGKHNFLDRSVILATSGILAGISVTGIKQMSHVLRPDGSSFDAFPSGHTATAFACAEFMYQEYKDVSVWYGIAGYTVAVGTGFMRMYNNRHWLTDVVAGAGFGIISTKIAYWVFPKIKKLFLKDIQISFSIIPQIDPRYGMVE